MSTLFYNGKIHTMVSEDALAEYMAVDNGKIVEIGSGRVPFAKYAHNVDLCGRHVYPCLIDAHVHLMLTIAVMAAGFSACEITADGVQPNTLAGVGERIRAYASKQKKDAVIAVNNYILTAMDELRMPTKDELDDWAGGRAIVVYNIDGHSCSLSSAMLKKVGIDPAQHDGVLQGEANESMQGKIVDAISSAITLPVLAKGVAEFHNVCADYGIGIVGALEGNADCDKDPTTELFVRLARHFDVGVRLYLQYRDFEKARPYEKYMKKKRVGGCGEWEMDGASGSHSAAFRVPYKDTGLTAPCYYRQEEVDAMVGRFAECGYQTATHAIGELAIEEILNALDKNGNGRFHRIEHCEFHDDAAFERLKEGRYAVMMQPGYAWIDKRYLHTYEQFLPEEICARLKFRSLYDAGICLCGSSDSPVQDMDPYLQMLGETQFYNEAESITPYQAMCTYTKNAARAIEEEDEYGTLEPGKQADFFTADQDFFALSPKEIPDFRPVKTYYGGAPARRWKGTSAELAAMMLRPAKML